MIVLYKETGWQVITQRNHGLLAGQICARWRLSNQPKRWVETLIATTEHDDVFNELEQVPLVDANGAPINFKMTGFHLDASVKLIEMALTRSRFTALLISKHISFTHGEEPRAKDFLNKLKSKKRLWMKEAATNEDELNRAYALLEFCDAFSLLICQEQIPPEKRKIEISSGPDGTPYQFYQNEDALIVEPWPFEVKEFTVNFEQRSLPQLKFKSDHEFRRVLENAAVKNISLRICSE